MDLWSLYLAVDQIQSLLPFGAFFSFSVSLAVLEMDGNYSNTEKYHSKCKSAQQQSLITSTPVIPRLYLQPLCWDLVQYKTISSRAAAKNHLKCLSPEPCASHRKLKEKKTLLCNHDDSRYVGCDHLRTVPSHSVYISGKVKGKLLCNKHKMLERKCLNKTEGCFPEISFPSQQAHGSIFHIPCSAHSSHSQQWLFYCCCSGKRPYFRRHGIGLKFSAAYW